MKLSEIKPGDTVTIRLLDGLSSDIRKKAYGNGATSEHRS